MSQRFRQAAGGRIDRRREIGFNFNGRRLYGYEGDTLASALLANGVRTVSRSFKYHRPRGVMSAGAEECGALLGVDFGDGRTPLVRATLTKLVDGLNAKSENCFPCVNFDFGRVLDWTRGLWPAGYYNKMFKWPNWHTFEWAVRAIAGLGNVPESEGKTRFCHKNVCCDVLIVGAGSHGLTRAVAEARAGRDVLLVDQDFEPGGALLYSDERIEGVRPHEWLQSTLDELKDLPNVRLLLDATVVGYYDHNVLTVHETFPGPTGCRAEVFWKVRAARVVLATGAIEQPLMFGNNDLPGIMPATAMHKYLGRFGVLCAEDTVAVVNNDLAWSSALALHDGGVDVLAIVDTRTNVRKALVGRASDRGIDVFTNCRPVRAGGRRSVSRIEFIDAQGRRRRIRCKSIAVSGGLNPTVHLYSQAGGCLKYDSGRGCFLPDGCRQVVEVVGAAAGEFADAENYNISSRTAAPSRTNAQWVDFLHDVLVSDIELAIRENFKSVEHLKRYTTTGMSVDQGKTSNLNALSLLADLTDREPGRVGTTSFRPLYMPVTMGAIAGNRRGDFYKPGRRLPAHAWHDDRGAVFDDYGLWKRPAWYGDDMASSIFQEVCAVRTAVGLFDGSPLGKFEIVGPDAAKFLSRIYVNTVSTLGIGKVRYGLMLNESGAIIDDGVFARMADDRFLVNTSSAAAERIAIWLEKWHQCEWPDLDLVISPVSSQWGVATIAGPRSRDILSSIGGMGDLSTDSFPHMSWREGVLDYDTPFRLQRVSFSGEQSYELSVPAGSLSTMLQKLMVAGKSYGIRPFGIEALDVLRIEKGYMHVGSDTDSTTNPMDVGFATIVANKKSDFVGKRSLSRPYDLNSGRRQLVGIETASPRAELNQGAHVVRREGATRVSEGFVTSSAMSPTLDRRVALGMVESGSSRIGEDIQLYDLGTMIPARIVATCSYDLEGERLRA